MMFFLLLLLQLVLLLMVNQLTHTSEAIEVRVNPRLTDSIQENMAHIHIHLPLTIYNDSTKSFSFFKDDTLSQIIATFVAIEQFNERNIKKSRLLKNLGESEDMKSISNCSIKFEYSLFDSGLSETVAVENFISSFEASSSSSPASPDSQESTLRPPDIIIGETRSPVTIPLSVVASVYNIPQLSYRSSSSVLSNKNAHPIFARTIPSDTYSAKATAKLLKYFGFKHFGILHANNYFSSSYKEALFAESHHLMLNMHAVSYQANDKASLEMALLELNDLGVNVFIGVLTPDDIEDFAILGKRNGIVGENKLWIFLDNILALEELAMDNPHIRSAFEGTLQITGLRRDLPSSSIFEEEWGSFSNYLTVINKHLPGGEYFGNTRLSYRSTPVSFVYNYTYQMTENEFKQVLPNPYSSLAYDTAITACLAICKSKLKFPLFPVSLDKRKIYSSLLNLEFEGNSGNVQFYPNGDRKGFQMKLINYKHRNSSKANDDDSDKGKKHELIGEIVGSWSDLDVAWNVDDSNLIFAGNTSSTPLDVTPPYHNNNSLTADDIAIGGTFLASGALFCIGVLTWIFLHRKMYIVRNSQIGLMCGVIFGDFVSLLAIIPLTIDIEPYVNHSCFAAMALYSIGITITMASLIIKLIRSIKGFKEGESESTILNDLQGYMIGLLLIGIDILILLLWATYDPLIWATVIRQVDRFDNPTESYGECTSKTVIFPVITVAYHFIMISFTTYLSSYAKKFPSAYQESKWVNLSLIFYLQTFIVGIPAFIAVLEHPRVRYLLLSTKLWLMCMIHLGFLFIPKMIFAHNGGGSDDMDIEFERKIYGKAKRASDGSSGADAPQKQLLAKGDEANGNHHLEESDKQPTENDDVTRHDADQTKSQVSPLTVNDKAEIARDLIDETPKQETKNIGIVINMKQMPVFSEISLGQLEADDRVDNSPLVRIADSDIQKYLKPTFDQSPFEMQQDRVINFDIAHGNNHTPMMMMLPMPINASFFFANQNKEENGMSDAKSPTIKSDGVNSKPVSPVVDKGEMSII